MSKKSDQEKCYVNTSLLKGILSELGLTRQDLRNDEEITPSPRTLDTMFMGKDKVSDTSVQLFFEYLKKQAESKGLELRIGKYTDLIFQEPPSTGLSYSVVGDHTIENMPNCEFFETPLTYGEIYSSLEETKSLPEDLKNYIDTQKESHIAKLKEKQSITDGQGFSLKRLKIDKDHLEGGDRYRWPELVFENASYYDFKMLNERLDEPNLFTGKNKEKTIRDFLKEEGVDFHAFGWGNIDKITIPQRFAVNVCLVLAGNPEMLVVGLRASSLSVQKGDRNDDQAFIPGLTTSCAEGMLNPDDLTPEGNPSPFLTAKRALKEELGLEEGDDYSFSDLYLSGFGYDAQRCQPVAAFRIKANPKLTFETLTLKWQQAKDRYENNELLGIPCIKHELDAIIEGAYHYKGRRWGLFSNHQRFGAAILLRSYDF